MGRSNYSAYEERPLQRGCPFFRGFFIRGSTVVQHWGMSITVAKHLEHFVYTKVNFTKVNFTKVIFSWAVLAKGCHPQ